MSTYYRNQPVATDDLDISQPFLVTNTNTADTVFGMEHYPFSNTSPNQGLHNTVTTPAYQNPLGTPSGTPPTTTTSPIFYGFQDTAPLGVIQYSKGPSNVVPSPLTNIQSPSTPTIIASLGGTSNVLDFAGITTVANGIFVGYDRVVGANSGTTYSIFWNGSSFVLLKLFAGPQVILQGAGSVLQISNQSASAFNNYFWTLHLYRIQV